MHYQSTHSINGKDLMLPGLKVMFHPSRRRVKRSVVQGCGRRNRKSRKTWHGFYHCISVIIQAQSCTSTVYRVRLEIHQDRTMRSSLAEKSKRLCKVHSSSASA